jgi:hypothetical protein
METYKKIISVNISEKCFIYIFYLLLFFFFPAFGISNVNTQEMKKPILNDNKAKVDNFSKDTIFDNKLNYDGSLKSGYWEVDMHSPFQDSAYSRALRLNIPASVRLKEDFNRFAGKRKLEKAIEKGIPWQIALNNLRFSPEILAPLPQDIVQRQEMINNAFNIPHSPSVIGGGFSVSLQDIGSFLGLIEDVSPVMEFDLQYTEEIEIVIYSVQAVVIATVYKGVRQPGHHRFVWNGRDNYGRPMPSGDYIGEVRIGNSRYIRKKITLP